MMAALLEMIVYISVNLLMVKMVFFRKGQEKIENSNGITWKSAMDSMSAMEIRLQEVNGRDLAHRERIWSLEDKNRDLQQRVIHLTKELLLLSQSSDGNHGPDFSIDDDDYDDLQNSVPTND